MSAIRPSFTNIWENLACGDARRMSQSSAKSIPMPTAAPLTAAIVGLRHSRNICASGVIPGRTSLSHSRVASMRGSPHAFSTSSPAQNARPAPVTTTARTSASRSTSANASMSCSPISKVAAFNRSGRLSVTVATWSTTS